MKPIIYISFLLLNFASLSVAADKLKIGVIQSTTGIAAEDGKTVVQALELAGAKLNDKVELLFEDDQTSSKNTVSAYQNLRAKGAAAIIGATWDFTTNALIPSIARDEVVLFNSSTLPESLSFIDSKGYLFSNSTSVRDEAAPFAKLIRDKSIKSIVTIYVNNSWGEVQRKFYNKIAINSGAKILAEYSSSSFDANEWQDILPAIRTKKPELILLLLNKNDIEIFLKRAYEQGISTAFFASKNAFDAVAATNNKSLYNQLCFSYPFEQLTSHKDFINEYREKFKEEPRIYSDSSYDTLIILSTAFEISKEKKITLQQALKHASVSGLVGKYQFSEENSFSLGHSSLMCVEDGKAKLKD